MSHSLKDLLDQDQLKLLAKRYLNVLKAQDPNAAPTLMQVQSNLAKSIGHNSWHEAQQYWASSPTHQPHSFPSGSAGLSALGYSDAQIKSSIEWAAEQELVSIGFLAHQAKQLVAGVQKMGIACISGISHDKRVVMERLLGALAPMHPQLAVMGTFDDLPSTATLLSRYASGDNIAGVFRMDPSWIAYDEVRDQEAAQKVVKMAQSGYSVLTSVLAKDALTSLDQFIHQWSTPPQDPMLFSVFCHVKQYPRLCSCAISVCDQNTRAMSDMLNDAFGPHEWKIPNPTGCPQCAHQGHRGQILCAEIIEWSPRLAALCGKNPSRRELEEEVFGERHHPSSGALVGPRLSDQLLFKTINGDISAEYMPEALIKLYCPQSSSAL